LEYYKAMQYHWKELAAGRGNVAHPAIAAEYRPVKAEFAGKCDYCKRRIRKGAAIRYCTIAPVGHKVICESCYATEATVGGYDGIALRQS
jgi:hypothetical protein